MNRLQPQRDAQLPIPMSAEGSRQSLGERMRQVPIARRKSTINRRRFDESVYSDGRGPRFPTDDDRYAGTSETAVGLVLAVTTPGFRARDCGGDVAVCRRSNLRPGTLAHRDHRTGIELDFAGQDRRGTFSEGYAARVPGGIRWSTALEVDVLRICTGAFPTSHTCR